MIDLLFACNEPGGIRVRRVTEITPSPATVLPIYKHLNAWNPAVTSEVLFAFYDENRRYWTVDDVGLLWSTQHPDGLEGHFVFWDGRLRGRENLVLAMADIAMKVASATSIFVLVPADKKMILAFLRRIGFDMQPKGNSIMCVLHSSRRV